MDQVKIGKFLKELRTERSLTQEQLADYFNVSNRTVSRWENGNNMPDISLLIELADFYDVEIRELLDGQKKNEHMNEVEKETLLKIADYSNEERHIFIRRMHRLSILALVCCVVSTIITGLDLQNTRPYSIIASFGQGATTGLIICGVIFTSKYALQIRNAKLRLLQKIKNN